MSVPSNPIVFWCAFAVEYQRLRIEWPSGEDANTIAAAHVASEVAERAEQAVALLEEQAAGDGMDALRARRTLFRLKESLK